MDNLPDIIGNCRITGKLGQGGMGAVYRAKHETLGREVAIKLLPPELSQNREYVARFLREARAAANLHHAHVVQVYDAGEQSGRHYITMEFVEGASLSGLLKQQGRIPEAQALGLMAQAAKGLAAAHALGLVHRDVKPENMLLNKNGVLKLADFGLVTAVQRDENLTQDGAMLGTPSYMSPEQCEGMPADARSDIYSLGASFYRLMTGSAPFTASTPIAIMFKHKHEQAPDPRSMNPELSETAAHLLLRMMAKDPQQRFQSAAELAAVAEALAQGQQPVMPASGVRMGQLTPAPGTMSTVGSMSYGTPAMAGGTPTPYTPTPAMLNSANTPTLTPGTGGIHGATTLRGTPLPVTQITGQTPAVMVPGTTIIQPASKAPLVLAVAALLLLVLGGGVFGAYYGLVLYPREQIRLAKEKAQELRSSRQYEASIRSLEEAHAKYPEAADLKLMRDTVEGEWIAAKIAKLKEGAQAEVELAKYAEAAGHFGEALALTAQGEKLPGFTSDAQLTALKKKTEDLRDFTANMQAGEAAEKAGRFTQALELFQKAAPFEAKGSREAETAATRATYKGLMLDAKLAESENRLTDALDKVKAAAALKVDDVTEHRARIERRIEHDHLVAQGSVAEREGQLRSAADYFEKAAKLAAVESAGAEHAKHAKDLVTQADYNEAVALAQAALGQSQWDNALKSANAALKAKSQDAAATKLCSQALAGKNAQDALAAEKTGNWTDAQAKYEMAAQLHPEKEEYRQGIERLQQKQTEVANLVESAQKAEKGAQWETAVQKYELLAVADPAGKTVHEQRAANARFELYMTRSRGFANEGKLNEAVEEARKAVPFDSANGERANAQIKSLQGRMSAQQAAAAKEGALNRANALVAEGKLASAVAVLDDDARRDPNDPQLGNLKAALEGVDGVERAYQRLQELEADAEAAIKAALEMDKDDKKMNGWLRQVQEWQEKLATAKTKARQAWTERRLQDISPAFKDMKREAREMAQLFDNLGAQFDGKAASASKPKAGIGTNIGGFGGRSFGGVGVGTELGDNQKHAGVYAGTAQSLKRCAEETRRLGATE